jgi:hypothetical protein
MNFSTVDYAKERQKSKESIKDIGNLLLQLHNRGVVNYNDLKIKSIQGTLEKIYQVYNSRKLQICSNLKDGEIKIHECSDLYEFVFAEQCFEELLNCFKLIDTIQVDSPITDDTFKVLQNYFYYLDSFLNINANIGINDKLENSIRQYFKNLSFTLKATLNNCSKNTISSITNLPTTEGLALIKDLMQLDTLVKIFKVNSEANYSFGGFSFQWSINFKINDIGGLLWHL